MNNLHRIAGELLFSSLDAWLYSSSSLDILPVLIMHIPCVLPSSWRSCNIRQTRARYKGTSWFHVGATHVGRFDFWPPATSHVAPTAAEVEIESPHPSHLASAYKA